MVVSVSVHARDLLHQIHNVLDALEHLLQLFSARDVVLHLHLDTKIATDPVLAFALEHARDLQNQ